jgi:hypothetical protein
MYPVLWWSQHSREAARTFRLAGDRVEGFSKELKDKWHVWFVSEIRDLCPLVDGILLESVDGRVHMDQFRQAAACGKPVYIEKPLASTLADAGEIFFFATGNCEICSNECSAVSNQDPGNLCVYERGPTKPGSQRSSLQCCEVIWKMPIENWDGIIENSRSENKYPIGFGPSSLIFIFDLVCGNIRMNCKPA